MLLESKIAEAYERLSLSALGFFVIHVAGRRFGVKTEDATMLSAAFDGVRKRIDGRGTHNVPGISNTDAQMLAIAFSRAVYVDHEDSEPILGMPKSQFRDLLYSTNIIWAPDGDE